MPEEPSTAGAVTCVSCRCDSSARLPGLRAPSPEPWVLPAPPRVAPGVHMDARDALTARGEIA